MSIKISEGLSENGVVVGNNYDKYGSRNPIVRWLMNGFDQSLSTLVERANPASIHEVGCGEGYWVLRWNSEGLEAKGSDFSEKVISIAQDNARARGFQESLFTQKSIYDLEKKSDNADLIVCCEVLEHIENPEQGLEALKRAASKYVLLSVPREPLWCGMNLARGKYISSFGNTPGHIQHWSQKKFINMVSKYFDIVEVKAPIPWTMLLCHVKE